MYFVHSGLQDESLQVTKGPCSRTRIGWVGRMTACWACGGCWGTSGVRGMLGELELASLKACRDVLFASFPQGLL